MQIPNLTELKDEFKKNVSNAQPEHHSDEFAYFLYAKLIKTFSTELEELKNNIANQQAKDEKQRGDIIDLISDQSPFEEGNPYKGQV